MAKGLGRGLGALLPGNDEGSVTPSQDGVLTISISKLKANPHQPRKEFDQDALAELADSIREKGIIQPILAEKIGEEEFQIIAGERRFRAAQIAGVEEVPVIIRSYSDEDRMEIALIENIQREDLTPMEEARGYRHLMESFSLTQEEVAKKVGKQRSTVANALRLLKLPQDMQESLERHETTPGHARAILSVVNPADQRLLYGKILAKGLSVREAEDMANQLNKGERPASESSTPSKNTKSPDLADLEQKFVDALGTKVILKGNGKKGSLEVAYYSTDDLARLFEIVSSGKPLF